MRFSFFKSKLFLAIVAGILIISIVLVFLFCRKKIEVGTEGEFVLWFNRMSEGDVERLYQRAKGYIEEGDIDSIDEISDKIFEYGGDNSFYSKLIDSHIHSSKGDLDGAMRVIYDSYKERNSTDFIIQSDEEDYLKGITTTLINAEALLRLSTVLMGIEMIENITGEESEKFRTELNDRLNAPVELIEDGTFTTERVYHIRGDAIKDAKEEGLFLAKKEAPQRLLNKIKEVVDYTDIILNEKVLKYIRENMIYTSSVGSVKRVPFFEEDLVKVEYEVKSDDVEDEEISMGWVAEVKYKAWIEDFSIAKLLEFAEVDIFEGE